MGFLQEEIMTCNALGSIFKKMCDSCICRFGTFCNCSQNHVVIIENSNTPAAQMMLKISRECADLFGAIKQVQDMGHTDETSLPIRSVPPFRKASHRSLEARAAVLHGIAKSIKIISSATVDMQDNEAMVRLTTAANLAGIKNIEDVYRHSIPIRQTDLENLEDKARDIKSYGSVAAFLWKHLKEVCKKEKDLNQLLTDGTIDLEQKEILKKIFKDKKNKNCLYKASFDEVDIQSQAIFLEAAHLSSKNMIKARGFIPWAEPLTEAEPSESSLKSINLGGSSGGGFPTSPENLSVGREQPQTLQFYHSVAYIHTTGNVTISQLEKEGNKVHVTTTADGTETERVD